MKTMFTAMFAAMLALLACQAVCGQICYAPQSESRFYLTLAMGDFYVANDFSQGKFLTVWGSDPFGDRWFIVDLINNKTYNNTEERGCRFQYNLYGSGEIFEQCLPPDATLVKDGDLLDFYWMCRPLGFSWLVGLTPVEGTDFYKTSISRFSLTGAVSQDVGVLYQYSQGISDPTVFDRDLSGCVELPFES